MNFQHNKLYMTFLDFHKNYIKRTLTMKISTVLNILQIQPAKSWNTIRLVSNLAYVPTHQDPDEEQLEALKQLLNNQNNKPNKVLVVTGAGISTESGLQDYRYILYFCKIGFQSCTLKFKMS